MTAETEASTDAPDKDRVSKLAREVSRQLGDSSYSPAIVTGLARLFEFCGLAALGLAAYLVHVTPLEGFEPDYIAVCLAATMLSSVLFELCGAYRVQALRSARRALARLLACWTAVFAAMTAAAFFLDIGAEFSRVWFASWYAGGTLLLAGRYFIAFAIRSWARNGMMERRAVIVGGGRAAEELIRALERQPDNDVRVCGIFDDREDDRSPAIVAGYPKLGTFGELVVFARTVRIDMLIISLPLIAERRILNLVKQLWVLPVDIRLADHASGLHFHPRVHSRIGAVRMLDIQDRPITDWASVVKRSFDVVFSVLGIVAFAPVMMATALAIKATSKGPVLFCQKRYGFNNNVINVYKFRSMYAHLCDPDAHLLVTREDPRVTPVGRFIRRASIDELPQFFNVLKGDLSLVGPRPHVVHGKTLDRLYEEVVDGYFARHRVKPGVTGWAQINGWRGEIDDEEKIRQRTAFDLYYIENWSLLFDLKILLLTPFCLFDTENVH